MKHQPREPRIRTDHPFPWPLPPLEVVLVHPEIPPNTGNIARLCAATGTRLHLVEPLGFRLDDRDLKRAGLDYWPHIHPTVHPSWDAFAPVLSGRRFHLFTTAGARTHFQAEFQPGDLLLFGSESAGLDATLLHAHPHATVALPQRVDLVRSLNLSTAVGIAVYEGLRQCASRA